MTRSAEVAPRTPVHRSSAGPWRRRVAFLVLLAIVLVVLAACVPGVSSSPAASGSSASPAITPTAAAAIPLKPASPGANPLDLLAWLFTPVFQVLFISLVVIDKTIAFNNIAVAIFIMTLLIRIVLIPLYRRQLESQRRMQLLQPELKELRRRHKDRTQRMAAEQEFYKARGINPAGGCLPLVLQFGLLLPIYSVFSAGLTNYNPQAMLSIFGQQLIDLHCPASPTIDPITHHVQPCLDTVVFGVDWSRPEVFLTVLGFGLSALAIGSSLLQLVQSRMMLPPADPSNDDPNVRIQRQTLLFVPLISILYGGILPAGLFLYWIGSTIFTIVQQYLIIGWGSLFPIFGWYPISRAEHTPRFPVRIPEPKTTDPKTGAALPRSDDRAVNAAKTIRQRGRQGRRGRRR